jgi:hypothetical protein
MCTLDERIIEYVNESILATPSIMSREIRFNASEARVRERCGILSYVGLIAPLVQGSELYEITTQGKEYLAGELDVAHQRRPRVVG